MRFKGLDLNLVFALDILLKERSVSRAARRLNLSQPAASAALSRLRAFFGDELLVQSGRRMIPTAFAESLQGSIEDFLERAEILVGGSSQFDPATSRRNFRIGASDYVIMVVLTPLLKRIEESAPNLTFDLIPSSEGVIRQLDRGEVDCILCPEDFISSRHPAEKLFEDGHVVLGDASNPLLQKPLTMAQFMAAPQVRIAIGLEQALTFAERHLRALEGNRRIEVTAPNFSIVSHLLVGTRRVAVVQRRLAAMLQRDFPLASQELPTQMPPLIEMVQYHHTRAADAGLRWLLDAMRAEAARLT